MEERAPGKRPNVANLVLWYSIQPQLTAAEVGWLSRGGKYVPTCHLPHSQRFVWSQVSHYAKTHY